MTKKGRATSLSNLWSLEVTCALELSNFLVKDFGVSKLGFPLKDHHLRFRCVVIGSLRYERDVVMLTPVENLERKKSSAFTVPGPIRIRRTNSNPILNLVFAHFFFISRAIFGFRSFFFLCPAPSRKESTYKSYLCVYHVSGGTVSCELV